MHMQYSETMLTVFNIVKYICTQGESSYGPWSHERQRKGKGAAWWGCVWALLLVLPSFSGGGTAQRKASPAAQGALT